MQRDDITKVQELMIRNIQSLLNQPPFSTKGSAGITEIKKNIDAYLEHPEDYFGGPKALFDKIKAIANSKEGGFKEAGRLVKDKGNVKAAVGQLFRAGKAALNMVDPTVQAFHNALIALDINDANNPFTKGKIKLAETTIVFEATNKRKSQTETFVASKRSSAVLYKPAPTSNSKDEQRNHAAMLMLTSIQKPDYNHGELDKEQVFLFNARGLIERLGNDELTNSNFASRQSYRDGVREELLQLIEDYRAVYHPKFTAKGEIPPTAPRELRDAFSPVMDILATKKMNDISPEDLYKLQSQCEKIYIDFTNVSNKPSFRPE